VGAQKIHDFPNWKRPKKWLNLELPTKKLMDELISNWSVHINGNGNEIYNGLKENIYTSKQILQLSQD
jgi:hypothetical protein